MELRTSPIIAVCNQKGGVGKTTTAINLAQALVLQDLNILLIDLDPQGNTTCGFGIKLESIQTSVADLIRDRDLLVDKAIYKGDRLDIIPATPYLARVEREMVGMTNSELRLMRKLDGVRERYSIIIIDTPPTFGPLMNAALNTAQHLIVPVDSFFSLIGIKELLAEVEEIKQGTNLGLKILGFLMTMVDPTNISHETRNNLLANFGSQVFETRIRRSVKLREAPVFGKTIFHHAPESAGAQDYWSLATEVLDRLGIGEDATKPSAIQTARPSLTLVQEACHE